MTNNKEWTPKEYIEYYKANSDLWINYNERILNKTILLSNGKSRPIFTNKERELLNKFDYMGKAGMDLVLFIGNKYGEKGLNLLKEFDKVLKNINVSPIGTAILKPCKKNRMLIKWYNGELHERLLEDDFSRKKNNEVFLNYIEGLLSSKKEKEVC